MTPEQKVLAAIVRDLTRRKQAGEPVWWLKTHGSAMQRAGVPDLLVCYCGRFVAIEVKRPGGKPTELQEHVLAKISGAGGVAIVADSAAAVAEILEAINQARTSNEREGTERRQRKTTAFGG